MGLCLTKQHNDIAIKLVLIYCIVIGYYIPTSKAKLYIISTWLFRV